MQQLPNILDPEWWRFEWRYWRKRTPWDTQITPPEVMAFLRQTAPGRALDLGCGTGTNAITLTQHGWQVTGVDFSPRAIAMARRKAARKGLAIAFHIGDVANLDDLTGPYDYALDIGCLFSLRPFDRQKYAAGLVRMLPAGAHFMLYAWLPQIRRGVRRGISSEDVRDLFEHDFILGKTVVGRDSGGDSAWYWFTRR
jgi:SAM-dependent methyltransferase